MTSESMQASAPDLSHLPYETRVRIAVAVIQGFWWECKQKGDGWWCLRNPADPTFPAVAGAHSFEVTNRLPDYLRDPAARGALMEREMARWETGEFDGKRMHRCWWPSGDDVTLSPGPWASSIGWAVCLAILAKHGITVEP